MNFFLKVRDLWPIMSKVTEVSHNNRPKVISNYLEARNTENYVHDNIYSKSVTKSPGKQNKNTSRKCHWNVRDLHFQGHKVSQQHLFILSKLLDQK